jgi:ribosomal protein S27E
MSENSEWQQAMDQNAERIGDFRRRRSRKTATAMGGDVYAAIPRFYDPTDYWALTNVPYDISKDSHRFKLYKWLDLFYRTHFLVPILVDIFTRFPLVGMELHSKDEKLKEFYEDAFFERLDYEQFLVDLGREYWTFGQSFPLGSFNETMGVWEREELLDPTLVKVTHLPIVGTTQFMVAPPPDLMEIVKTGEPKQALYKLRTEFPELLPYLQNNRDIPISDVLLQQVAFKVSPRDTHGTPILLRALRTLMHEEKLVAAQDAIAERLYSPLVLAKLGTPDLGDGEGPWIPDQGAIQAFRDDLDIALSSDFRLLVHHFGVEISNVFGREQMPRLDQDFDRIEQRLMMTFGMNPALLAGNQAGQPYATSALNAELMNQLLHTYQGFLKRHMEKRMKLVAEAQEHYDYEKRGETRVPIMEEVIEYDEEGNPNIVEKNKLLIPDVRFQTFDLRDEQTQRQFLQQLKAEGVPVSDKTMAFGVHFDFEEELEKMQEETIQKTVTQQEAKVQAYRILQARGLPIPPDLKAEIEGGAAGAPAPGTAQPGAMGITPPGADMGRMTPEPGSPIVMPNEPGDMMGGPSAPGGAPAAGAIPPGPAGGAPEISSERMRGPGLPTPPGGPGGLGRPRGASVEAGSPDAGFEDFKCPECGAEGRDSVYEDPEGGFECRKCGNAITSKVTLPRRKSSATLPELVREKYVEDEPESEQTEE